MEKSDGKISRRSALAIGGAVVAAGISGLLLMRSKSSAPVSQAEIAAFSRDFSHDIDAGKSLVGSLSGLAQKQDNPVFRQVLTDVEQTVEQGYPLSRAMAAHPQVFDAAYVKTVREGEINGNLEVTLRRYAAN